MNWWFNNEVKIEDEESMLIEEFENKKKILDSSKLLDSKEYEGFYKLKVYKMSGKELVKLNPRLYKNQRIRSEEHVNSISKGLKEGRVLHHNFILVKNGDRKSIEVYDGQHRIEALKKKSETSQSTIDCYVNIYEVNTNDEQFLEELFNEINIMKGNTKEERNKQLNAVEVSRYLQESFGTYYGNRLKIVDQEKKELKREEKWKLSYHELKYVLEKLDPQHDQYHILKKLVEYNKMAKRECSNKNLEFDLERSEIFFKRISASKDLQEKCHKYEFYLGINFEERFKEAML
jgi:hypothetical protein